jgi:RNA polymerase sigma-70 factor (ECF subfamily)
MVQTKGDSERRSANAAMDRYASGEAEAFAEVYDALADRLYRFLARRTGDSALAEDLLQQTFLHMHCARETYVTGGEVVPWAFCIARRLSVDTYRRSGREILGDLGDDYVDSSDTPEEALSEKQTALGFHRALSELPEPQRVAFELTKYDGLSHAEAAHVLGTTVTAVKLRVHRAYELLRASQEARTRNDRGGLP